MKFQYTGVTRQKEQVSGVVDAPDEIEAKMRLRAMQIRPIRIVEAKTGGGFDLKKLQSLSFGKAIDLKGMVVFTRQFSSLVDSGVPIVQCLDILHEQEKRPAFKKILGKIKADIEGGSGLAESFGKHPKEFSEFFLRIVEAGELSGTLDKALQRVGQQLEKLGKLKNKVVGALMYPMFTLIIAGTVLIFLLVKVIPEVAKLYTESNAKLPDLTVQVLGISKFFQNNYLYMIGGIVGAVFGISTLYKMPGFRKYWDPFALYIPLVGTLIKKSSVAKFSRTMSTLIASGVPLLQAFDICIKLMGNLAVKEVIQRASTFVSEGKSIAAGLTQGGLFPPMVIHMVNIGEMTGKLDELLAKVADIYDDEVDDAISAMTGMIQPLLIIIVGGIICFLLLAMYLPIFQLADKVGGA